MAMWILKYTGQFKKDLKRYQNQLKKIDNILKVWSICQKSRILRTIYDTKYGNHQVAIYIAIKRVDITCHHNGHMTTTQLY